MTNKRKHFLFSNPSEKNFFALTKKISTEVFASQTRSSFCQKHKNSWVDITKQCTDCCCCCCWSTAFAIVRTVELNKRHATLTLISLNSVSLFKTHVCKGQNAVTVAVDAIMLLRMLKDRNYFLIEPYSHDCDKKILR